MKLKIKKKNFASQKTPKYPVGTKLKCVDSFWCENQLRINKIYTITSFVSGFDSGHELYSVKTRTGKDIYLNLYNIESRFVLIG